MPATPASAAESAAPLALRPTRLGVVSFLNTLPLIDGLDDLGEVRLQATVPSLLIEQLESDAVDVALVSAIDYQQSDADLAFLRAGMLGCDGPTMTVRIYSTTPIAGLRRVYADTDSHTSVVLMQILMREIHGRTVEVIPYHAREHVANHKPVDWPPAMLLIGDKVVTDSPPAIRYPHQWDLGEAWKDLTGLPFVFAAWMTKQTSLEHAHRANLVLDRQRRRNMTRLDQLIARHAPQRGWPRDLATTYVRDRLRFDFNSRAHAGLARFYDMAHAHGLSPHARPLAFFDDTPDA